MRLIIALGWRGGTCSWNVRLVRSWHNLLLVWCKEGEKCIHGCWMQRTECGEKTLNRCVWVAWLIAVCKWKEACSRSPSTGSNPIHWSWLLCLWYHTRSENHDDKGVPLSWALHRLLNPHKSVEEPRLKISTRLCRFRIVVLVRVIKFFYHGTWHYFF